VNASEPFGAFYYQTFNETEWLPFTYAYINGHSESGGFSKPGSNNYTESRIWRPRASKMWSAGETGKVTSLIVEMDMPAKALLIMNP